MRSISLSSWKQSKAVCCLPLNSPYFGRGSNSMHNWKWLLWSICYAFVLPTSATQAPPGGCSWGICFFPLRVISPLLHLFLLWCLFFMTIHTSVEIALDFSPNALLSSCLCLNAIRPSLPRFFFPLTHKMLSFIWVHAPKLRGCVCLRVSSINVPDV